MEGMEESEKGKKMAWRRRRINKNNDTKKGRRKKR